MTSRTDTIISRAEKMGKDLSVLKKIIYGVQMAHAKMLQYKGVLNLMGLKQSSKQSIRRQR